MTVWIPWLAAAVSTAVCLYLWFREVRRIVEEKADMVSCASGQVESSRRRVRQFPGDAAAAAVLRRSEDICRQAQLQYRQTLRKPWIRLPALLMGYRMPEDTEEGGKGR